MNAWQTIFGHSWAVQAFSDAVRFDRVGHAWLIAGPDQVGKLTLARVFAMALNCTAAERPCGECRACRLIAADRHPDVAVVQPEVSGRGKLTHKIEAIRELQRALQLAAYEGRYKVALVRRFDAATAGAANAFLKTLEEPPARVVLVLTARDADAVPETIKSRCRVIPVRPLPVDVVRQALVTGRQVPYEQADRLAQLSGGRLGWAVRAAQEPALAAAHADALAMLRAALAGNRTARFKLAERLADKPDELPDLLAIWSTWWRDLLLTLHGRGAAPLLVHRDEQPQFDRLAAVWSAEAVHQALRQTETAAVQLGQNANTRLVLEVLFLRYPSDASAGG